jgi:rhodanese-related sulfurtransferase
MRQLGPDALAAMTSGPAAAAAAEPAASAASAASSASATSSAPAAAAAPILLDVREPWEFLLARIERPGAELRHIPMGAVPPRLAELPRTQPIVCICHHGVRSAQVVAFLLQQGWHEVYNLAGGIDAWSTQVDPSVPRY